MKSTKCGEVKNMIMKIGSLSYFMQLTIAGSDGEIEDEESEQIRENIHTGELMDMMLGLSMSPGYESPAEMFNIGLEYYNMHASQGTLTNAFCVATGGLPMDINWDMSALTGFYNCLVGIAAADGEIEPEEERLLDFVKAEWGV